MAPEIGADKFLYLDLRLFARLHASVFKFLSAYHFKQFENSILFPCSFKKSKTIIYLNYSMNINKYEKTHTLMYIYIYKHTNYFVQHI